MKQTISVCIGALSLDVEGQYYPGCAATGPSYASGGDPSEESSFEIHTVFANKMSNSKADASLPLRIDITAYIDDMQAIQDEVDNNLDQLEEES